MNFQPYKKILERYGYNFSEEEVSEIVKNIEELARVFLKFEKRKANKKYAKNKKNK